MANNENQTEEKKDALDTAIDLVEQESEDLESLDEGAPDEGTTDEEDKAAPKKGVKSTLRAALVKANQDKKTSEEKYAALLAENQKLKNKNKKTPSEETPKIDIEKLVADRVTNALRENPAMREFYEAKEKQNQDTALKFFESNGYSDKMIEETITNNPQIVSNGKIDYDKLISKVVIENSAKLKELNNNSNSEVPSMDTKVAATTGKQKVKGLSKQELKRAFINDYGEDFADGM